MAAYGFLWFFLSVLDLFKFLNIFLEVEIKSSWALLECLGLVPLNSFDPPFKQLYLLTCDIIIFISTELQS